MKKVIAIVPLIAAGTLNAQVQEKVDKHQTNTTQRPNILWLTYEDTSPDFIGCYGNSFAKTPNIDALAKSGVTFNSAFSTGAVSSPSRFCLITGVKAFSAGNGSHRSTYPVQESWNGFPYYLRQAGYYTTNNAKTDYNLDSEKEFIKRAWDESSPRASWRGRKPGQNFFAVYNSNSSHQSRTMTFPYQTYENMVLKKLNDDEITKWGNLPMPAIYRNSEQMQKNISRVYNSVTLTDKEFGEWLQRLEDDGLKDSTIVFCFSDHGEGIPRGKCAPVSMGYRVAFSVWIPPMYKELSPYGSGIFTDDIVTFEDFAPTILALASVEIPDHMQGVPFMGKNLPTEKRQYAFSGVDRTDENTELSRSVSDGKYIYTRCFIPYQPLVRWHTYHDVGDIQKQIREDFSQGRLNEIQASIVEPRQAEYLYDIRNDQWETRNLISMPEYAETAKRLRDALKVNIIKERDPHFMPEQTIIKYAKQGVPPSLLKENAELYDAQGVINAAYLVGMGSEVAATQTALLNSKNEMIQYWAALGLFSQKGELNKYRSAIEKHFKAMSGSSLAKLYLAATLDKNFSDGSALEYLYRSVSNRDSEVQRLAFQLINTLSTDKQKQAIPYVDRYLNSLATGESVPMLTGEWIKILKYRTLGIPLSIH